ncbi:putative galacturonosyltransferase 11 [Hibiscus syriacus]|uniref:Hexosyltransferase n=1 Tax=Hibiscus syriacus TaxID=106335 RepID=A0A6A3CHV0_HIBSY|nr:hexosyltransferase GAUT11-like [Hibiscus syriacus]KAE8727092.1 putative galacturonosyltransferase 11 [Hibiscus syriacus]
MRRRANDYRRPARRRFSHWIYASLGLFVVAVLFLFVVHHNHNEDRVEHPVHEEDSRMERDVHEKLNFTEEILSATSLSRQLAEQMTLAKAYVIIAKEHNNFYLAWELTSMIRSCQLLLSKAAMRGRPITLEEAEPIITRLSSLIYKAQDAHYDIATMIVTMKSHIQALEERANSATAQSTVFGQLVAEAFPKSLHCLILKLSADWFKRLTLQDLANERRNSPRLVDNNLYHFCVFSDNVLATSVVVNSTISNADHSKQMVFHIVTNGVAYGAMQAWFLSNDFKGAMIEVQNIEEFSWLNVSYAPIVKKLLDVDSRTYYFGENPDVEPRLRNPNYIALLNHLRFYIPEIYPQLEKIVFLDDDVVQKDLTPLFSLDLHGNVNGAVETCLEAYHRYYRYLNFSNPIISSKFDPQACGWAFGMNVFDLVAWRKANVTARYHYWQEQNANKTLWKLGTLPVGLLAFYGLTEPLDRRWHVLGLGYDLNIDSRLIESAAVIHFNGNMKPWLKLAIGRYKPLWESYINLSHPYIQGCATS